MAHELPAPAESGRVYEETHLVGPGDTTPSGRMRLDEIARWLQDVAFGDLVDAGLRDEGFWILRRTRLIVERFPRFAEELRLRTFCTGASALAAERRTSVSGSEGAAVEAVSIWVNIDRETRVPARLPEAFWDAYGDSTSGRKARLSAPGASARPTSTSPATSTTPSTGSSSRNGSTANRRAASTPRSSIGRPRP